MKCSIQGCTGEYKQKSIAHTAKYKGNLIVITDVPAKVCDFCGDTLLSKETTDRIFILLETGKPNLSIPAFSFVA
jgi:YgiT-type zinc finger domain-containing protein